MNSWKFAAFVAAACSVLPVSAQQRPGAADAASVVPRLRYESAFSDYRSYSEPAIRPWTALNDEVAKVGGHRGIFGGASATPPVPAITPAHPTADAAPAQGQTPLRGAPQAPGAHAQH